jgi:hypothetical protein
VSGLEYSKDAIGHPQRQDEGHAKMLPERLSPWKSVGFAVCLSAITLGAWWRELGTLTAFLCFLPICFYFNAEEVAKLRKQVNELQRRLDERDHRSGQAAVG